MTYIKISTTSNAIPIFDTIYEPPYFKKIHPDILFETPIEINKFIKILIVHLKYKFPGAGLYQKDMNLISLGFCNGTNYFNFSFKESLFTLQKMQYYDFDEKKCYHAFNTSYVSANDLIYFSEIIKLITKKIVYLNINNRQHPYFDKLISHCIPLNVFKDYNEIELKYFGKKKYQYNMVDANVTVLISFLEKNRIANDLIDIIEI